MLIKSAARAASISVGALVLPEVILGKLEASTTRKFFIPTKERWGEIIKKKEKRHE